MATETQLISFINRHRSLLAKERNAEVERSTLLLSNCGPKLLEQKGLALLGLGVVGINIGLGGKTFASRFLQDVSSDMVLFDKCSLVELERPTAYHSTATFPPHTLR
jgi:DNA polymerase alpha-associated DNA helicase A